MNKIFKIAAAALTLGFLATSSFAGNSIYDGEGIVIVPASTTAQNDVDASDTFPAVKRGKIVDYKSSKAKGSIIVNTKTNELFYVLGFGKAVKYRVATAKKGFEWKGTHKVSRKAQWPDWRPPQAMIKREALNGKLVDGRALTVNVAKPREERSGGGGERREYRVAGGGRDRY